MKHILLTRMFCRFQISNESTGACVTNGLLLCNENKPASSASVSVSRKLLLIKDSYWRNAQESKFSHVEKVFRLN